MVAAFFEQPILNSPYEYPSRHWELDVNGQPTQEIVDKRRPAEFITPIPKPRQHKKKSDQRRGDQVAAKSPTHLEPVLLAVGGRTGLFAQPPGFQASKNGPKSNILECM